jgi:hypothetical protein
MQVDQQPAQSVRQWLLAPHSGNGGYGDVKAGAALLDGASQ